MKVLLDIPDKQAAFAIQVLNDLKFVKKVRPMVPDAEDIRLSKDIPKKKSQAVKTKRT